MTGYTIREVNPHVFKHDLEILYQQLSPEKHEQLSFGFLLKNKQDYPTHFRIFGAVESESDGIDQERVVSMATLSPVYTAEKIFGQVHDVVTDKHRCGKKDGHDKSLAEEVLIMLIDYARIQDLTYLELTCKPGRECANRLYQKVGFKMVSKAMSGGTNLYRMYL